MLVARMRFSSLIVMRLAASAILVALAFLTGALAQTKPPQRARSPLLTQFRLVDARGGPVAGAVVAGFFWRDNDRESSFAPTEDVASKTTDERGEASLVIENPLRVGGTSIYAHPAR